ncbi:MAG: sugar ABC transporter permease [Clostridiales bacterium]|nr:sugar ABC transporter permease [Clostridiales bacterium]
MKGLTSKINKDFSRRSGSLKSYIFRNRYQYLMCIPGLIYLLIFKYIPLYGITLAFKDFSFKLGILKSPLNNFANFRQLFGSEKFYAVLQNSLLLSVARLVITFPIPIILALLLNEIRAEKFKRMFQTLMYLPHFISWVVLGGILTNFLSVNDGLINILMDSLIGQKINFLGSAEWFRTVIIAGNIWKEAGWGTIIYLAALSSINPEYYEAAIMDGANRYQQLLYITLPSLASTIVVTLILAVGGLMNNGFEQIYLFQNGLNISVSEVFETYTYRIGIVGGRYSYSTAVGLFKSLVAAIMLFSTNRIANRLRGEALF